MCIRDRNAVFTRALGVSRMVQLVGDDRTSSALFLSLIHISDPDPLPEGMDDAFGVDPAAQPEALDDAFGIDPDPLPELSLIHI